MADQNYDLAPVSSAIASLALSVSSVVTVSAVTTSAAVASIPLTGATSVLRAAPVSFFQASPPLTGATSSFRASPICVFSANFPLVGSTFGLNATAVSTSNAVIDLIGFSANVKASPASAWIGSASLSGSTASLSTNSQTSVAAVAGLMGFSANVKASPASAWIGSASLFGSTASLSTNSWASFEAVADLTGGSDSHGMSLCDVVDDVLAMWGIFCRKEAPDFAIDAAINFTNQSLQLVWNNADGRNYWTNVTVTLTLSDGQSSTILGDDIQNVIGPCRLSVTKQPLVPIGTIGELETFDDLYLDGGGADSPVAYHIERMNQSGGDPAKCVFHVNSVTVGEDVSFLLEVVKQAPRFTPSDLDSCPLVPIPHGYVESMLLPIARYQASSYYLFRMSEQKPTIDREYQQAMVSLGLADPINPKAGDNKEKGGGE